MAISINGDLIVNGNLIVNVFRVPHFISTTPIPFGKEVEERILLSRRPVAFFAPVAPIGTTAYFYYDYL